MFDFIEDSSGPRSVRGTNNYSPKESLASDVLQDHELCSGGQIRVYAVDSEGAVMSGRRVDGVARQKNGFDARHGACDQ